MAVRKFVMQQFFMKNQKLSKFHIFEVDGMGYTLVALCGTRMRRSKDALYDGPRTIDKLLGTASWRYKHYNNKQPCKRCLKRAEQMRNPLDRLSEV